jgi:hypothetical protein
MYKRQSSFDVHFDFVFFSYLTFFVYNKKSIKIKKKIGNKYIIHKKYKISVKLFSPPSWIQLPFLIFTLDNILKPIFT